MDLLNFNSPSVILDIFEETSYIKHMIKNAMKTQKEQIIELMTGITIEQWEENNRKLEHKLKQNMNNTLESLQRYDEVFDGFNDTTVRDDPHGTYVKFNDVAELVKHLQQQINDLKKELEAKTVVF